jgi:hypothetical protein
MPTPFQQKIGPALAFGFFGLAVDFLCNGVFKIGHYLIYGAVYLVVALTLNAQLAKYPQWAHLSKFAVYAFLIGAFGGRFILAGHSGQRTYMMTVIKDSPITLKPMEGPQVLIVVSEKLTQKINTLPVSDKRVVPVVIDTVSDYGCLKVFNVHDVAGVDVKTDNEASWSWKTEAAGSRAVSQPGLGTEDHWMPWCIQKSYALEPL